MPREREAMLVEERSVGRGGAEESEEEEEEVEEEVDGESGTAAAAAAAAPPPFDPADRSTSLGAPLEISHSEASPPAAHQTRGPDGGERIEEPEPEPEAEAEAEATPEELFPTSLSHGAAATVRASMLGAPASFHAATRISSLASPERQDAAGGAREDPGGAQGFCDDRADGALAGGGREDPGVLRRAVAALVLPPLSLPLPLPPLLFPLLFPRQRRSQPWTPPRAVE